MGLGGAGQSWVCCGGGCFYAEQMMCLDKTVRLTDPRVPRAGERERERGRWCKETAPFGAMQVGAHSPRRVQGSVGGGALAEA